MKRGVIHHILTFDGRMMPRHLDAAWSAHVREVWPRDYLVVVVVRRDRLPTDGNVDFAFTASQRDRRRIGASRCATQPLTQTR